MNVSGGFSLVELVVVLAVMALGAAVAVPAALQRDEDASAAAAEVLDVLHRARLTAMRCSCVTRLQIRTRTGKWFMTEFRPGGSKRLTAGRMDPHVTVREAGGETKAWIRLVFGPFGRPQGVPPVLMVTSEEDVFRIVISPNSGAASAEAR